MGPGDRDVLTQAVSVLAEIGVTASAAESFGPPALDIPVESWAAAHEALRDEAGLRFFDFLTASDELSDGFRIVSHLADFWGGGHVDHLMLRTLVPRATPRLASLTGVYAGANWHERQTFEMFGIEFDGHPNLVPLLLPDGFEGNPLRKEFVLASRVAKPWPGAKEPGESDHGPAGAAAKTGAPSRRRTLPPGVPDPETWGPRPPGSPDPDPLAAAQATSGPARPRRAGGERRAAGERRAPGGRRTGREAETSEPAGPSETDGQA
jgi:NADH-quinone oxidoreductase subunit C